MNSNLNDIETVELDEPQRITQIDELSIGDKIVFARRRLSDEEIESKRPLQVVDGATRTLESTHEDPEFGVESFVVEQHAVEVRGGWEGAATHVLADSHNTIDGSHWGLVDFDSGIKVEVALVAKAEPDEDDDDVESPDFETAREIACDGGRPEDDETELHVPDEDCVIMTDGGTDLYTYRAWCYSCSWSRTHNHEKEAWAEHRAEKATRNHKLAHDHDDTDYGRVSEEEMQHKEQRQSLLTERVKRGNINYES